VQVQRQRCQGSTRCVGRNGRIWNGGGGTATAASGSNGCVGNGGGGTATAASGTGSNGCIGNGGGEGGDGRGGTVGTATTVWAATVASGTAAAGQQRPRRERRRRGGWHTALLPRWEWRRAKGEMAGAAHRVKGTRARHSTSHWRQGLGRSQQRRPSDRDANRQSTSGCRDIPRRRCRRGKVNKKVNKN
jgi:hypothetical protein